MSFEEEFPSLNIEYIPLKSLQFAEMNDIIIPYVKTSSVQKLCLDKQRVSELYITKALVKEVILKSYICSCHHEKYNKPCTRCDVFKKLGLEDEE